MRTIKASEFKAKCLQLMDEIAESGQPVLITKRGRPVSVISPYSERSRSLFGLHKGSIEEVGDIVAPTGERWDVER